MAALPLTIFWICAGIAVCVFSVMLHAAAKYRRSGAPLGLIMGPNATIEVLWTLVPILALAMTAIPVEKLISKQADAHNSGLSIHVTGYQWRWQYRYGDTADAVSFFSTLKQQTPLEQRTAGPESSSTGPPPLEVDRPLVIPSGTKVRLLLTSMDVIHAWWVPDFGAMRSAIPGLVNELWIQVDVGKEGIYRGQCVASCGRDHALMPVVVDVRTPEDFKKWLAGQKAESVSWSRDQ